MKIFIKHRIWTKHTTHVSLNCKNMEDSYSG